MFRFFFPIFTLPLVPGDNPYHILNASQNSTLSELRLARLRQTYPLLSSTSQSDIDHRSKITESYVFLSHPFNRLSFSFSQQITPTPIPPPFPIPTYVDEHQTHFIPGSLFPSLIEDQIEWVLFVFTSLDCDDCFAQHEIFEEAARTFQTFTKVGRVNATSDPLFAKTLSVTKFPSVVSIRPNGKHFTSHILGHFFKNHTELLWSFFTGRRVPPIENGMKAHESKGQWFVPATLLAVESRVVLSYVALKIGYRVKYARFCFSDSFARINYRQLAWRDPQSCLFFCVRRGPAPILYFMNSGESWLSFALNVLQSAFVELTRRNYDEICGEFCLGVVAGEVDSHLNERFGNWTFRIVLVDPGSVFAKRLRATEDDRIVFAKGRAWRIPSAFKDEVALWALSGIGAGVGVGKELRKMKEVSIEDLIVFPRRDKYWIGVVLVLLVILIVLRVRRTLKSN
jgi:thiol-disulfide isomerase/thioredoxin